MSILVAHSLASLLVLLISPCLCLIRRANILLPQAGLTSGITAASDLPVHQPQRIDVSTFKGVKVAHVDTLIQHLRSHVPETHTHTPNSSATNTSSAYYNTWWYLADFLFKCGVCVCVYLLVPTRWLGAMSIVSVTDSWRTARPRSAMAHVRFFFTRMFFDFRSR